MQNEGDRGCDHFIWVDEEAMLPVSHFNAQIAYQKKNFETELAKLTLQIDAEKRKNTSMEKKFKNVIGHLFNFNIFVIFLFY
jgi:hypothetical protein